MIMVGARVSFAAFVKEWSLYQGPAGFSMWTLGFGVCRLEGEFVAVRGKRTEHEMESGVIQQFTGFNIGFGV